ncbi:hypothetical protein VTI74DRAFT_8767 [Chaetomium olivicolor]
MRIPRYLFLAFAGLSARVFGRDAPPRRNHGSSHAVHQDGENLGLVARYPEPSQQCNSWVGIEMIHMVKIAEICPEGSSVTQTLSECVSTLTRSICATPTTNRPCYPCVLGTPASTADMATVTVTSCSTVTDSTVTVTIQYCSTCTQSTYVGTIPGYSPGGPCHGCSPYSTSQSAPCTNTESSRAVPQPATATTTTPGTIATVTVTSGCTEDAGSSTTPPGNPKLPSTTTTAAATHTPYRPTTAAPPIATAAGVQNAALDSMVWLPALMVMLVAMLEL